MATAIEDDGELLDDMDDDGDEEETTPWYSYFNFSYAKHLFMLLVLFLLISSDVFIDKVLSRISGAVEHKTPTSKGVMVQATCLILALMVIDVIINLGYP